MSDAPTPRTDAAWKWGDQFDPTEEVVTANFARQLERELAEATKQRDALASDCERFRYAIDQTAFYFDGTSSQYIADILTRVLSGESVEEIRASNAKALTTLERRGE